MEATPRVTQKKKQLKQRADAYKDQVHSDFDEMKTEVKKWGTTALVVGGTILAAYTVVKIFSSSSDDEIQPMPAQGTTHPVPAPTHHAGFSFSNTIKRELSAVLMVVARKKLIAFLKERNIIDGDGDI